MGAARPPGPLRPAGVVGAHLCVRPLAGAPRGRGPARPGHRFCCQKRWENHQGPRCLRWLRVDFHRRRPWRLRPWTQGLMAAVGCVWLAETGRASPPVVDASFRSFASPQAAKLTPSTASPLPTEPASLGFGGGPVFAYVQALPRLGWHASGLPCKPWELLRCTRCARRAAIGAMPLKYHGACGNWGSCAGIPWADNVGSTCGRPPSLPYRGARRPGAPSAFPPPGGRCRVKRGG